MVNKSFENFFESINQLKELEEWGKNFWKIDQSKIKLTFAQKGYEDKGVGHSRRILSNVGDLLEKYFDVLYQLNHEVENINKIEKKNFQKKCFKQLKTNLILFYIAAYLHDIGMNFAGIFQALSDLVAVGGDTTLHIGEIIHKYHHYASFIVLLEMNYLDQNGKPENDAKSPYLFNIRKNPPKENNPLDHLKELKEKLEAIYLLINNKFFEKENFFVALAIICLMHKDVNWDYVQSILMKYKSPEHEKTIHYFNKSRSLLDRAMEWTEKLRDRISEGEKSEIKFSGKEQVVVKVEGNSTDIFDLLFVEALLQYGDKTEITIARLARKIKVVDDSANNMIIPLEHFLKDIRCDNQKGFICTDMAQQVISSFARFRACRFIPLILVDVQEVKENVKEKEREEVKEKIKEELDVIFHYFRFENDEDVYRVLRYHNEKDFFDLGFLEIIRIHMSMLLDYFKKKLKIRHNPFLEIKFKKVDHHFVSLDDELKGLCDYFLRMAKKDQKEIQRKVSSKESTGNKFQTVETESKNLLVDFLNTLEPEQIPIAIQYPVKVKEKDGLKVILNADLKEKFKNYLNRLMSEIVFEVKDSEESKKYLEGDLNKLFSNYWKYANTEKDIQKLVEKANEEKKKPEIIKNALYKELKKVLVDFLVKLKIEQIEEADKKKQSVEGSNINLDDELDKKLCIFKDTLAAKRILQKSIYGDAIEKTDPKDRFPYTPQNRKAVFEHSKSILDPEEKKKDEGTKKVFCKTCDLIVPSSFELMAILNLFREEE